ncbi:MAG: putative glycoside hydrolase, partial [Gemmatimonadaceae bacterium]
MSSLVPLRLIGATYHGVIVAVLSLSGACERATGGKAGAQASTGGARVRPGATVADRRPVDSLAAFRASLGNRVARPDSVRALYVNAWAAGSRSRVADLIRVATQTEINAFVIDIKESDTYLAYADTRI